MSGAAAAAIVYNGGMTMDLTPWNRYVLLAAFLLLVVYGILTIPHLRKLS